MTKKEEIELLLQSVDDNLAKVLSKIHDLKVELEEDGGFDHVNNTSSKIGDLVLYINGKTKLLNKKYFTP
ncbi:MAG: hypothetical protein GY909_16115 [Oligoflexia bacterium]|nr:hypothetical protein [Oligoflexia bacterium]